MEYISNWAIKERGGTFVVSGDIKSVWVSERASTINASSRRLLIRTPNRTFVLEPGKTGDLREMTYLNIDRKKFSVKVL